MRLFIPLLTRSSNHDNRFVSLAQMLDLPFSEDLMQLVSTALEDMDDFQSRRWTEIARIRSYEHLNPAERRIRFADAYHLAASLPETRAVWTRDNSKANRVSLLAHWRGSLRLN